MSEQVISELENAAAILMVYSRKYLFNVTNKCIFRHRQIFSHLNKGIQQNRFSWISGKVNPLTQFVGKY